ncbi:MAG: AAA family ATPase [Solirubrobacterales bacterium]
MPELPEGPVTMMFTDVVGSTALRTKVGDGAADELFRLHDELVRGQIAANKGFDQGAALGDGFLAVFVSTRRALACAIGIQKALDGFNQARSGALLSIRIGLNTGEVAWADGQLSGEAVHAASRVCAAGSGGQILVSDVTRQLAGTVPDVSFRDAGEFQLKGFPQPWQLWEVIRVRETTALPEQVFVGRDREIEVLRSRLLDALDGRGGLVLVGGEPGVGKTTLVKQLIREAEQRGALALFGRCYESEGAVPYSPFVEMLEQALALMPPEIVREDMGDDAPEVARMVPALRRRFPDIPEPLDLPPEQQQRYFFNAVGSFVSRGSHRFPLMIVMDDVHWADESTLLLIEHMAALMPDLRVLGVGTYRDVELDVSRPLAVALERLTRDRLVERLPVRRFDRATVATMIEGLAGKTAPAVVVDAIFDETEGNPFFVEEVFRHLAEDGTLFDGGEFRSDIHVDELDVPESVRLVVGRRLERLGDDARKILAAGAVVGRGFPFDLLEEIVDVDSGRLIDVVEAAEAARVIVAEERGGEVHYSFGHELIRQTLLSGLSVLRRQRLHLAVADAIERTDRRARHDRPSEIAHHLLAAGSAADRERTLEFLELAAERALEAAAFEEALSAVDDALSIVDPDDHGRRSELLLRRGSAVRALGRFDECITIWDELIATFAERDLVDDAADLCYEAGYLLVWLNRFEEAFATFARGLAIVGDQRTAARSLLLALNGGMLGLAGFYEAAAPLLDEAEEIARSIGDDRTLGRVLWGRSISQWCNGWVREALESGRAAIHEMRKTNDQWYLVDALAWTSFPLILSGRPDEMAEGRRLAAEGMELGRRLGHRGGEVLCLRGVAMSRAFGADLDVFERAGRDDLEAFSSVESPWSTQSHIFVALVSVLRGDLDDAAEHVREAIDLEPVSAWTGLGQGYDLLVHAWRGETETCRQLLDAGRSTLPAPGARPPIGQIFRVMTTVQACVVADLPAEAAALYPVVAALVDDVPVTGFDFALTDRVAGMAAAAGGQWDDAVRHFDAALRRAEEIDDTMDMPQVEHWFGEMLVDRGRPEDQGRARDLLTSAIECYGALGMPLLEARARQALTRTSSSVPP